MAKGKKRDYSLPKGVSSRVEQSKLAKAWQKGENKYLGEASPKFKVTRSGVEQVKKIAEFKFDKGFDFGKGGGYIPIPEGKNYYWYDEFGEWNKEALAKILETTKPEIKKDPLEEFTDEWYEKNKDSI